MMGDYNMRLQWEIMMGNVMGDYGRRLEEIGKLLKEQSPICDSPSLKLDEGER